MKEIIKQEQWVILPTKDKGVIMSDVGAYDTDWCLISELPENLQTHDRPHNHLYLTSDEDIKENDWCVDIISGWLYQAGLTPTTKWEEQKKIIATTDTLNTRNSLGSGDIPPLLPGIPEFFIKYYVEKQGKVGDVICEYNEIEPFFKGSMIEYKKELILNLTDENEIMLAIIEDTKMYSREEVEKAMDWNGKITQEAKDKWIKENLKWIKENLK